MDIDNMYGPQDVTVSSVLGITRFLSCNPDVKANIVPINFTVSALIASAWNVYNQDEFWDAPNLEVDKHQRTRRAQKSEKHQQLKTFLHPRCFPYLKEFPSRIEYDEHRSTPAHMKNAVRCEEQRKNKKKDKLAKGEAEVCTAEGEEKDVCHDAKNEKEEDSEEQEYITGIIENITEKKFKIPSYKY
ncbi:Uncharacterized protein DBV15_10860 [Temnothorax longispinosus]|uniref:Uncharacterized protein n=1 Tax=Temnothorax longispinosus TaxID=300112 RepID=A0A4V3S827_9HYME|nr:Uncharacterized protein DBV15_10860 [Temnothorax longispinosus]